MVGTVSGVELLHVWEDILQIISSRGGEGYSVGGAFKMPTSTRSSVKHSSDIYLTVGQWVSGWVGGFSFLQIPILCVSLHLLFLFVFPSLSALIAPTFIRPCLPSTPQLTPCLSYWSAAPRVKGGRGVLPGADHVSDGWRTRLLLQRVPWSLCGAKSPSLIVQLQLTDKRPWSLILLKADYQPVCILFHP